MESSSILPLSNLSIFCQKPHGTTFGALPFSFKQFKTTSNITLTNCQKMHVSGKHALCLCVCTDKEIHMYTHKREIRLEQQSTHSLTFTAKLHLFSTSGLNPCHLEKIKSYPSLGQRPFRARYMYIFLSIVKREIHVGFGEASPETKAAKNLHNFFTYVAVRIVIAQLADTTPEAHKDLLEFVDRHSLNDGDKFCAALMRESPNHKTLGIL
ncbi:putative chaperonin-like RbcX [Helianthus anomalus]